jgi:hypothetical protein
MLLTDIQVTFSAPYDPDVEASSRPPCSAIGDEMELTVIFHRLGVHQLKVYSVFARIANAVRTRAPQTN